MHGSNNDCAAVGLGPMGSGCMFINRGDGWGQMAGGPAQDLHRGPMLLCNTMGWPKAGKRLFKQPSSAGH